MPFDTPIRNAVLITCNPAFDIIRRGWVGVKCGRIAAQGRETEASPWPAATETIKRADLIVIDSRAPHLTPLHHPASAVVYAARGSDVHAVMVGGLWLLRERRLQTLDIEEIVLNVNRLAAGIAPL